MQKLQSTIEQAWEDRARLAPGSVPAKIGKAVAQVLDALDAGRLRVAEKLNGTWQTHQWIKKAVLLSFRIEDNRPVRAGSLQFYDKVRTKFERYDREQFQRGGFRVVPPAVARRGAYIAKNVVLMPSYVNVGAYVDEGTMVDTWATVGSCAQIGKNVHLSGGVGIGGVLEPLQANPTIVEDNCFVGARSEIVEGVIVEENAVISMRLSGRAGHPALCRRQVRPLLRGDRETSRRQDPRQDRHQRAAARRIAVCRAQGEKGISESIRPRSRNGLPARRNQELGRVPSCAHRSYVNFAPPAYPSAGAIGASLVVKRV